MQIINITADGNFNALDLPRNKGGFKVQARSAVNIDVRVIGATDYWTLKSGTAQSFEGVLGVGGIELRAANGTIIEILIGFSERQSI